MNFSQLELSAVTEAEQQIDAVRRALRPVPVSIPAAPVSPSLPPIVRHDAISATQFQRSPLIYAGNKSREAQRIVSLGPSDWSNWTWCEPFVGSAGLFLNAPKCASYRLADINQDVINLLHHVQVASCDFYATLDLLFQPENNTAERFAEIRLAFNGTPPSPQRSGYFLFLNRSCFNGVIRYNKRGEFNMPWGRRRALHKPLEELLTLHERLNSGRVSIASGDFHGMLDTIEQRSVVLLDPPYLVDSKGAGGFVGYDASGFTMELHEALAGRARRLADEGHWVIALNNDSPTARKLHSQADEIHVWPTYRRVAASAKARGAVMEQAAVYRPRR